MRLGEDLSGGLFRRLMAPSNPAGLWYALAVAVGLMVLHQLLQLAQLPQLPQLPQRGLQHQHQHQLLQPK